MTIEHTGKDVNGQKLVDMLMCSTVKRVTIESSGHPTEDFIKRVESYGFTSLVITPQLDEDCFRTSFTRHT